MPPRINLRRRAALWMCATALVSLVLFGLTAWTLVWLEMEESPDEEVTEPPAAGDELGEDASEQILDALLIAGPIAMGAAVVFGAVWSRRITRPLKDVVDTAQHMTTATLDSRLAVPEGHDEVAELVASLNGLFARLEDGFAALDRHVTEASHELRTPISVASARLQVALRHPRSNAEWQKVARSSLGDIRRMGRLIDALLRLARTDADGEATGAAFDLTAAIDDLVEPIHERATALGLSFEYLRHHSSLVVVGDEDALLAAIRALLDNAMDHAPQDGTVKLSLDADRADVRVHVDDNGPGVAPADRERIFLPYERGAHSGDRPGLGLGLSIARRLIERTGGTLTVGDAPTGGARFTIHCPAVVVGSVGPEESRQ